MRQVISFLDHQASLDADRIVWARASTVQKYCKNYSVRKNGKPTNYSMKMVEVCLKALRDKGIISRQHAIEIQERRNYIVKAAFVVTPHDALCVKAGETCCRFVGMGKVPGTRWATGRGDVWFVSQSGKDVVEPQVVFESGKGVVFDRNEQIFKKIKDVVEKGNKS
jgi:hypothetical protein